MTMQIANKAADCAAFKLNGVKACMAAAGNNMVQVLLPAHCHLLDLPRTEIINRTGNKQGKS